MRPVPAVLAGENPTGTVTVVNTATAEDYDAGETELNGEGIDDFGVAVYGGTNVTVTASGMDVVIGDDTRAGFVVAPSGTVTVTNMVAETLPYDGGYLVADTDEYVDILGGTVINVMTNAGDVVSARTARVRRPEASRPARSRWSTSPRVASTCMAAPTLPQRLGAATFRLAMVPTRRTAL